MNERHPYEKWLGEKLDDLPVPDMKKSWQDMQALLDHEMPQGRSKRRGGWWFPGAMVLLLIMSSVLVLTMDFSPQNGDPPTAASQKEQNEAGKTINEKPEAADDKILHNKQLTTKSETGSDRSAADVSINSENAVETRQNKTVGRVPVAGRESSKTLSKTVGPRRETPGRRNSPVNGNGDFKNADERKVTGEQSVSGNSTSSVAIETSNESDEIQFTPARVPGIQPVSEVPGFIHDSIDLDQRLTVQYAKVDRRFYRMHRRHYKPANVRAPYTTNGRTFALGLSLPLGYPLGDQKMLGYNASAGPNTTSDYIPSVHLQYHFNSKSYIQAEIQAMSPQYIRPVMVYHKEFNTPVSHTSSSIFARKLYYLNLPVSVHYSPFRHFYLGTGLQLSSMLSGVAQHENVRTGMVSSDSIYQSTYAKFGNDSIGARLRKTELRVLLDANYYWNRFTVGLRYTQALSNYISMRASPVSPYTFDKNKSLQFYLRFNLWEWKKREALHERILTFK
jgi:hypothetical protein